MTTMKDNFFLLIWGLNGVFPLLGFCEINLTIENVLYMNWGLVSNHVVDNFVVEARYFGSQV